MIKRRRPLIYCGQCGQDPCVCGPVLDAGPRVCAHLECNRMSAAGSLVCGPCGKAARGTKATTCKSCDPDSEEYL